MKKIKISIVSLMIVCASFYVNNNAYADNTKSSTIQTVSEDSQLDWSKNIIKVTGSGAPPDKGNMAQKRNMAIRAAKLDAYRQLLEIVNGIHVSSETIVKDFVTESDVVKTKVEGILKGFEQVGEPRYMSDGSVEVDVQIKIFGKGSVASAIMPEEIKKISTDTIPNTKIEAEEVKEDYTGIIIDCKGLGAKPAMSPALFDSNGGQLYVGDLKIDPDYVINEGIVSYAESVTDAKKIDRAGANPLIIKAIKASGNFKSDIILKNEDAKKLLGANKATNVLEKFKVIMVL